MLARIDPLLKSWRWPALALLAALAMLAAAHAFERFAFMAPCPLCLRQREVYWAIATMAATGLVLWRVRQNPRFLMALNVMLGLVFLTGLVVAFFHAGVEWRWWPAPDGCTSEAIGDITNIDLSNLDERQAVASCLDAPWVFLGLSMAGWNALVSLILMAVSFRAAGIALPRPRFGADV